MPLRLRSAARPHVRVAAVYAIIAVALCTIPARAQQPTAGSDARARRGSELLIPAAGLLVPGLGQYLQGAWGAGLPYTATAAIGYGLATTGDADGETWQGDLPRRPEDQFAEQADAVAITAAALSAWDAFHRAVPALQRQGRYEFLTQQENVGDLLTAPFDLRFLRRWTTWVDLAQTAAVTALILSERDTDRQYHRFRAHDAAWAAAASGNAAVSEEAIFRGWLLPLLHQNTGQRFWIANSTQAALFGAAHLPDAEWFAAYIGAWALWEGWITRRNDWSVRESIFHHFWYDVGVFTAALLVDERPGVTIRLPTIRF